ncbi:MAG: hypothetical protein J0H69_17085 [Burkholderiales bacterium]|nr:hypothetical protein [Burkholderiales bacterium]
MFALLYALAHGLPVLIAGQLWPTKKAVLITAAVMSVVAVALGQLAYAPLDLAGVAVGLWLALLQLPKKPPAPGQ